MLDERNIGLVSSRFNPQLCDNLVQGARLFFNHKKSLVTIRDLLVPGAYELPLGAKWLIETGLKHNEPLDGVVALGVVIRGETPHFDYVAGQAARGLMQVGLEYAIPIGFGVITADNYAQAAARASLESIKQSADVKQQAKRPETNKGYEAAEAVWDMIQEKHRLKPL